MGFVLSKFRKEKSTTAVLEGLQLQIKQIETYMVNTQESKRRFVANFVGFTIGVYIIGFALWYFFYFPPTMQERIMYLVPLLLFPILIVFLRQMFTWYFQRKLNKLDSKLAQLKAKKSSILEQVMEKETYKVAVSLLERFGDKQQQQQSRQLASSAQLSTTARSMQSTTSLNRSTSSSLQMQLPRTPQAAQLQQQRSVTPYSSVYRNMNNNLNRSLVTPNLATPAVRAGQELRRRTPFPVVDEASRSALDRIVDFIVGDSPQNRLGMICKKCHRHNGMLPLEEYEYTTFYCAFCETLNPARKERPIAPRLALETESLGTPRAVRNDSSASSSSSDDDEDETALKPSMEPNEDLPTTETTAAAGDAADAAADAELDAAAAVTTKDSETEPVAAADENEIK